MFKGLSFFILLVGIAPTLFAQILLNEPMGFRKPKTIFGDRCKEYREITKKLPPDLRFDVRILDGYIFVVFPSESDFNHVFDRTKDGLVVDVVHQDMYSCESNSNLADGSINRGYLLPPIYRYEIRKRLYKDVVQNIIIPYGPLPELFNPDEIECNLLILQKKALCDYQVISNIEFESWELLDMGMYRDSISDTCSNHSLTLTKVLEFVIPFEKNIAEFDEKDIKPLYDSLNLTDYTINEIHIKAFTSVEGSQELNRKLQERRAQSIADALQTYQSQKIKTQIRTEENWSQFAKDIRKTPFSHLRKFTKKELQDSVLQNKDLLNQLEPLLAKQRKGEVRMVLEKNISMDENDPEKFREYFNLSLNNADLNQALAVQRLVFDKVKTEKLPSSFLGELEIPRASQYGPLFNNLVLFNWERQNFDLLMTIGEFEKLEEFLPDNPKIRYNILALKIKAWSEGPTPAINRETLGKELRELERMDVPVHLVNRLRINYNLLLTQYLTYEKNFPEKKKAINNVMHHYRNTPFEGEDAYRVAKFLAFNSEFKRAIEVLEPLIKKDNTSEDVLFYYLKLVLSQPGHPYIPDPGFFEKVIAINQQRFCTLFLPKSQDGYTFQLKDQPRLKNIYCSTCE